MTCGYCHKKASSLISRISGDQKLRNKCRDCWDKEKPPENKRFATVVRGKETWKTT